MKFLLLSTIVLLLLLQIYTRSTVNENNNNNNNNNLFTAKLTLTNPLGSNVTMEEEFEQEINFLASKYSGEILGAASANIKNIAGRKIMMQIGIGENSKMMNVMVDTGCAVLWVITTECSDKDAGCQGHDKVDTKKEKVLVIKKDGFEQTYPSLIVKGDYLHGTVYLTKDLKVIEQVFGGIKTFEKGKLPGFDGIFGLAIGNSYPNPFMNAVSQKDLQVAPIFSIYIKEAEGSIGEITFGGSNEARFKKNTKVTANLLSPILYRIQMTSLSVGKTELCKMDKQAPTSCVAYLDVGSPFIVGPPGIVNQWAEQTFKTLKNARQPFKFDCVELNQLAPMVIQIGNKALTLEPKYYTRISDAKKSRCYLQVIPLDLGSPEWIIGLPINFKYYTEYNIKSGEEAISFYEAIQ